MGGRGGKNRPAFALIMTSVMHIPLANLTARLMNQTCCRQSLRSDAVFRPGAGYRQKYKEVRYRCCSAVPWTLANFTAVADYLKAAASLATYVEQSS
jgi:hypothetical protein